MELKCRFITYTHNRKFLVAMFCLLMSCTPNLVVTGGGGGASGVATLPTQSAVESGSENDDAVTTVSVAAAGANLFLGFLVDLDEQFKTTNICMGKTIFGRLGVQACILGSRAHRDIGSAVERAIPVVNKDHDGLGASGGGVDGNGNPNPDNDITQGDTTSLATCGDTQATVEGRIADCNYGWDGRTQGNTGQGSWSLVTKMPSGNTVWRDNLTKLMWTQLLSTNVNWCQASGNTENTGDTVQGWTMDCTPGAASGFQPSTPVSLCAEGPGLDSSGFDDFKGNMRLAATANSPSVIWRLPTRDDYFQAFNDGGNYASYDLRADTVIWSATVYSQNRFYAWFVFFNLGRVFGMDVASRDNAATLRCAGTAP